MQSNDQTGTMPNNNTHDDNNTTTNQKSSSNSTKQGETHTPQDPETPQPQSRDEQDNWNNNASARGDKDTDVRNQQEGRDDEAEQPHENGRSNQYASAGKSDDEAS